MENIIELSDVQISREKMDKYKIAITHNPDKNTHTIYSYLIERLELDQKKDTKYNPEQEYSIYVNTYSVISFENYLQQHNYRLDYDTVLKILQEYSNIIQYLERSNKSVVLYSLEDLIVINDSTFIFLNNENIFTHKDKNPKQIEIDVPLEITKFSSPELQQQTSIPFTIDYRSGFFSLASILTYCLFAETLLDKDEKEVEKILEPIINTKLYWFILRCGERNIKNRVCLFV